MIRSSRGRRSVVYGLVAVALVGLATTERAEAQPVVSIAPTWGPLGTEIVVRGECDPADVPAVELQHLYGPSRGIGRRFPIPVTEVVVDGDGRVEAVISLPSRYRLETGALAEMYASIELGYQLRGAVSCDGVTWSASAERFTVADAAFVGVPVSHPFHEAIAWAGAEGISTGYENGEFEPDRVVSRQAMVAYLYRLVGSTPMPTVAPQVYRDVPKEHPFFVPIVWTRWPDPNDLSRPRYATGYADNTFRPGELASREAVAAFLYRLAGEPVVSLPTEPTFSDVAPGHAFYDAIEWVAATGIVEGYPDGRFGPTAPITRQAAVAMLHRFDQIVTG